MTIGEQRHMAVIEASLNRIADAVENISNASKYLALRDAAESLLHCKQVSDMLNYCGDDSDDLIDRLRSLQSALDEFDDE